MTDYPSAIRLFSEAHLARQKPGRPERRGQAPIRLYPTPLPAQRRRTVVRLWLPLTALFLLLSPFALLLSPFAYLAPRRLRGPNPLLAAILIGRLLLSLGGTEIDVDTRQARVHIRIF